MLFLGFKMFNHKCQKSIRRKIRKVGPYFIIITVVDWAGLFIRPVYKHILIDSLKFCQANKGLVIYSYVIMSSHLHLIVTASNGNLPDVIRDIKRYTNIKLIEAIEEASKLRKQGDNLEIVGKKLDDGIVVSDDFERRVETGEATKSYDELSSMGDDAGRTEVMSSGVSKRNEYMGSTPGKDSSVGQEVIDRMAKDGKIQDIAGKKNSVNRQELVPY